MGAEHNRRRIIEVGVPKNQETVPHAEQVKEDDESSGAPSIPLEMFPVIRTLVGYGRRAHGLGGLRGARALEHVIDCLIPHLNKCPELIDVIVEARNEAEQIRVLAQGEANGETGDS